MAGTNSTTGFVYFIDTADGLYVKIGHSIDVYKRLKQLKVCHPSVLEVRGYVRGGVCIERMLHYRFREERGQGEWFVRTDRLDAFINSLIADHVDGEVHPYEVEDEPIPPVYPDSPKYYRIEEAARLLRISDFSLYSAVRSGRIDSKRERIRDGRMSFVIPSSAVREELIKQL